MQLEEAIFARIKEYGADKELVAELARLTGNESKQKTEHQKSMISVKEQDRRKLDQKYENLMDAISETDDKVLRSRLSEKLAEISGQLQQTQTTLDELKDEYSRTSNVIDISSALGFYRIFSREFDKQDVFVQTEIIRDYVKRIVVRKDGVTAEVFGSPRKIKISATPGPNAKSNKKNGSIRDPSAVRTAFKLVGPTTANTLNFSSTKIQMITRVQYLPLVKQESFLRAKYESEGRSVNEIAELTFSSRQTVVKYLETSGIGIRAEDRRLGPPSFGLRRRQHSTVLNAREQAAIDRATALRATGMSYEKIALVLNTMGMKTRSGRAPWYPKTVRDIVLRANCQRGAQDSP